MTKEQILEVCKDYVSILKDYESIKNDNAINNYDRICHCVWMLKQIPTHLENGKWDKVMRWLGFIQGVLWSYNIFTIEDMKNHNR